MTIGAWIGMGVGVAGLLITIATLIVNNTKANTRLACAVENLSKVTDANCKANERDHDDLWGKIDEHDDRIGDHETRIQLIEKTPRRSKVNA